MGNIDMVNYAKREADPRNFIPPKEISGGVHVAFDQITRADGASGDVTSGDILRSAIVIPKGCRILDCGIRANLFGNAGKFKMGISGDDDGLVAEIDPGAAVVFKRADELSTLVGTVDETADRTVIITCTETSVHNGATGRFIYAWVLFSMP